MQNQFKPQVEASVEAAYELANLSFSQVERLTQLALEQSKINAALAQEHINAAVEIKDPAAAMELIKEQLDNSVKSFAGFAYVVVLSGALMGLSMGMQILMSLYQMWFFKKQAD